MHLNGLVPSLVFFLWPPKSVCHMLTDETTADEDEGQTITGTWGI